MKGIDKGLLRATLVASLLATAPQAWSQFCPLPGNPCAGADDASQSGVNGPTGVGNPIDVTSGNKYQQESDVAWDGELALNFRRHYNSLGGTSRTLGRGWTHGFDTRLVREQHGAQVLIRVTQADGRVIEFRPQNEPRAGVQRYVSNPAGYGVIEERRAEVDRLRAGRVNAVGVVSEAAENLRPWRWQWLDGNRLDFDGRGLTRRIANSTGDRLDLDYDVNGRLMRLRDAFERELLFSYWDDATERLSAFGARGGAAAGLKGARAMLKSVRTPDGADIRYGYDEHGMLAKVLYPDGTSTRYEYSVSANVARLSRIVGRDGKTVGEYRYDESGRAVSSMAGATADKVELEYRDHETWVRNGRGEVSVYRWFYKPGMNEARIVEALGPGCDGCAKTNVRYAYDAAGALMRVENLAPADAFVKTRALVSVEVFERDSLGRVTHRAFTPTTGPARSATMTFDADESAERPRRVASTSVAGGERHVVELRYTATGAVSEIIERGFAPRSGADGAPGFVPIERSARFEYYPENARHLLAGKLRAADGPLPGTADTVRTEVAERDGRREVVIKLPLGLEERTTYDQFGRVVAIASDLQPRQVFGYHDSREQYGAAPLLSNAQAAGVVSSFAYDGFGRLQRRSELDGYTRQYFYGSAGEPTAIADSNGRLFERQRDPRAAAPVIGADGLRDVVAANGVRTSERYDDFGRLALEDSPDRGQRRYDYDSADRLLALHEADGGVTHYQYDLLDRMTERRETRKADTFLTRIEYARGLTRRVIDPNQETEFDYDAARRVIARRDTLTIGGRRHTFERGWTFDDAGRVSAERLPDGTRIAYEFAGGNRMAQRVVMRPRGGDAVVLLEERPAAAARSELVRRRGEHVIESLRRDASGRVVRSAVQLAAANGRVVPLWSSESGFAPDGALTTRTEDGTAARFSYDDFGHLAEVEGVRAERFAYDAGGNRLSAALGGRQQSLDYLPASNRLAGIDGRQLSYDAAGRPLTRDTREFRYGANGRLAEVRGPGIAVSYDYNAFGERIGSRSGQAERHYIYDSGRLAGEVDAHGNLVAQFVYGAGAPLARLDYLLDEKAAALPTQVAFAESGKRLFGFAPEPRVTQIHSDALGVPRLATDEQGAVVWRALYASFGRATIDPKSTVDIPQRLPGQVADADTGLHYNYFRDYDPDTGRYLTPDPLGLEGGANLYAYVGNQPLSASDPLGLEIEPADGVRGPPAWLIGTYVHNVAFAGQIRARGGGWGGNDGRAGTWTGLRPDGYFVDPANLALEASRQTFAGTLWELKPISWAAGPQRAAAVTQVAGYVAGATRGCWLPGSSSLMVRSLAPMPMFIGGRIFNIMWEPDPVDASGLVYYTYTATTVPVPVPRTVPVTVPEPSTRPLPVPSTDSRFDRVLRALRDALEWIGMALLEIIKWLLILVAVIIVAVALAALVSAAAAESAVAAIILGIVFMIDQMRGGSTTGEEGMAALTGREEA